MGDRQDEFIIREIVNSLYNSVRNHHGQFLFLFEKSIILIINSDIITEMILFEMGTAFHFFPSSYDMIDGQENQLPKAKINWLENIKRIITDVKAQAFCLGNRVDNISNKGISYLEDILESGE